MSAGSHSKPAVTRPADPRGAVAGEVIANDGLLRHVAHGLLDLVIQVLESEPSIAARFRGVVGAQSVSESHTPSKFMTVREYASHARLSERTIRHFVKEGMTDGLHFHRDGRAGRRVIIHPDEADAWRASRSPRKGEVQTVEELATNEVLQRRARTALRKVGPR